VVDENDPGFRNPTKPIDNFQRLSQLIADVILYKKKVKEDVAKFRAGFR
jgi:carbamate kinase